MAKLDMYQIDEYFSTHLPYRIRILTAHYWMTRRPWTGNLAWLEACFEASLITGRMFLNVLGVTRDSDVLKPPKVVRKDDVTAIDLGGRPIDIASLPTTDADLFIGFLRMADKAAAHLTTPMKHPVADTHAAISRICYYVRTHLYDPVGRTLNIAVP